MFSPEFSVRAAYPTVIYTLAASSAAASRLKLSELPGWVRPLYGIFAVGTAISVSAGLGVDYSVYRQAKERMRIIEGAPEEGSVTLKLYKIPKILGFFAGDRAFDAYGLVVDIDVTPEDPYNSLMASHKKEDRHL